jgi:hypothetical protein
MKSTIISTVLLAITLSTSIQVAQAEELQVTSSASAYGNDKEEACRNALNFARSEAVQSAITHVSTTFISASNDKGVSQAISETTTSTGYARLVKKDESLSIDQETGQIKCLVEGSFLAGFTSEPNTPEMASEIITAKDTDQVELSATVKKVDIKAGEPFCLKYLHNACFREYYDSQLGVWGIQQLGKANSPMPPHATTGHHTSLPSFFFITEVNRKSPKRIETKEQFIEWYDSVVEGLRPRSSFYKAVSGYILNNKTKEYSQEKYTKIVTGLSSRQVGFFTLNDDYPQSKTLKANAFLADR